MQELAAASQRERKRAENSQNHLMGSDPADVLALNAVTGFSPPWTCRKQRNKHMELLAIILIGYTAIIGIAGFAYRSWLRPIVAWHFGEESGRWRDRNAVRRRRAFESRIVGLCGCAVALGSIRCIQSIALPVPAFVFYSAYGACVLFAFWVISDAVERWKDPLNG